MNELPPRVVAAERRRAFRELLHRSSLGCPRPISCGHMLYEHGTGDYDRDGNPHGTACRVCDCDGVS